MCIVAVSSYACCAVLHKHRSERLHGTISTNDVLDILLLSVCMGFPLLLCCQRALRRVLGKMSVMVLLCRWTEWIADIELSSTILHQASSTRGIRGSTKEAVAQVATTDQVHCKQHIRVSVDVVCPIDCALGGFVLHFLFGCKDRFVVRTAVRILHLLSQLGSSQQILPHTVSLLEAAPISISPHAEPLGIVGAGQYLANPYIREHGQLHSSSETRVPCADDVEPTTPQTSPSTPATGAPAKDDAPGLMAGVSGAIAGVFDMFSGGKTDDKTGDYPWPCMK